MCACVHLYVRAYVSVCMCGWMYVLACVCNIMYGEERYASVRTCVRACGVRTDIWIVCRSYTIKHVHKFQKRHSFQIVANGTNDFATTNILLYAHTPNAILHHSAKQRYWKRRFILAVDTGLCELVVTSDLSAAFDASDHSIVLHRLESKFDVSGFALAEFVS